MKKINVEDIEYIEYTKTTPAKMYFFNGNPKITKPFLFFFKKTVKPEMKEGWGQSWEPYYNRFDGYYSGWQFPTRYSEKQIEEDQTLVIFTHPRAGRELLKRAYVFIKKKKSWHTAYFDTNEEAEAFIKEIEEKCTNKWQLITK
tara:strand:- start:408 stop:839 length:432 start_codon:yes stop_codon:yes gene_type:complete